jgi:dienelactone hydrolase
VINHGKAAGDPRFDPRARYAIASREFVKRGYAVALPMRRGYSKSGGSLIDAKCNTESNGRMQGDEILEALASLFKRQDIDSTRVLLVGQSYGGIASVAAGSAVPPSVKGILNFAGGIKRTDCGTWEVSMVDAFGAYGKESRTPNLWFYGDNDSYWGPELPRKAHAAYVAGGGNAKLVAYGNFADGDAHSMFGRTSGLKIWWPETERFLESMGLPTKVLFELEPIPPLHPTGFATLEDANAVPHIRESNRERYIQFLRKPPPRAFAIARNGAYGYGYGEDAADVALNNCAQYSKDYVCRVYALDDQVVWQE